MKVEFRGDRRLGDIRFLAAPRSESEYREEGDLERREIGLRCREAEEGEPHAVVTLFWLKLFSLSCP